MQINVRSQADGLSSEVYALVDKLCKPCQLTGICQCKFIVLGIVPSRVDMQRVVNYEPAPVVIVPDKEDMISFLLFPAQIIRLNFEP